VAEHEGEARSAEKTAVRKRPHPGIRAEGQRDEVQGLVVVVVVVVVVLTPDA